MQLDKVSNNNYYFINVQVINKDMQQNEQSGTQQENVVLLKSKDKLKPKKSGDN